MGDTIRLGRVLAHKADGEFKVGQPYLDNVAVEAEILEEFRGPKVRHGVDMPVSCQACLREGVVWREGGVRVESFCACALCCTGFGSTGFGRHSRGPRGDTG